MKKHGKNCMAVSKTLDDFGTNTFQIKAATNSGQMELGEILNAIEGRKDGNIVSEKEGYGMHFYYGGDLETSSSTSTYDDPLGTTIAPAPDPSSLPPETSDYPTTSKQVTIIKNYNGSVVKTKKISFYNELTCMFRGRKNPPSGYLSYAAYGRSIAG